MPEWPRVGPAVPVGVLSAVAGLLAAGLVGASLPVPWLLTVVVAVLVALWPAPALVVGLVLVLAALQALQPLAPVQPRFFALLAGVHLLVVLTALVRTLPRGARVQLAALGWPLGRYGLVQVGAQLLAVAVLVPASGQDGGLGGVVVPFAGVVGAVVLLVAALALIGPLLRRPPR
ncbi:hypothetical protein [Quadrisphaera sp. INWT6]|uniref:hypothetical protein n=1 Tax=Quadrisphaera sp. INWT6 TaxID=2596917 RepID=UPI001892540A|nr:hypothetical protein [Quadrisphaera sp. INWT6]MBF5080746.1 hypothetical protein [Quadrisphaera sp. INWT6]